MNNTLLKHTIAEIHEPSTGRIDGIKFADFLGLSYDEMAKIVGRTVPGLRKNPTSEKLQDPYVRLYVLIVQLRDLLDDSIENVRIWLRSPHPALEDRTPLSCLLEGKIEEVETLVDAIETGGLI